MGDPILHLDWETRSACDLKSAGLYVYAQDPTTDLWLASFAFDDEPVENWFPGEAVPKRIVEHIKAGLPVYGHNVTFEIIICNEVASRHGWPPLDPRQCHCTMAMAYAMALPATLERAASAMGIKMQKDMAGHRLMLQMCQPRDLWEDGTIIWWDDPDKIDRLAAYGRQDVEVERELGKRLPPLSKKEREIWLIDQRINSRGIAVDVRSVETAIRLVESEKDRLNGEMREVTGNSVGMCTAVGQLKEWIKSKGIQLDGVAKAEVTRLLSLPDLPEECRRALDLRQEAAKSSTAKLDAMRSRTSADGRIRGIFQYHGASTGRWAGRGIQPQNLPKPKLEQAEIEKVFEIFERAGVMIHG